MALIRHTTTATVKKGKYSNHLIYIFFSLSAKWGWGISNSSGSGQKNDMQEMVWEIRPKKSQLVTLQNERETGNLIKTSVHRLHPYTVKLI